MVDPSVFCRFFRIFKTPCFFRPEKAAQTSKKKLIWGAILRCWAPKLPKGSFCRCDGGDCCRNVGHETVSARGEQSSSHQNQRKKLRRHKLKGFERNKHGCTRKMNMRTPCVKNPPQEQQTHDRFRRYTNPTLPTGAHSC